MSESEKTRLESTALGRQDLVRGGGTLATAGNEADARTITLTAPGTYVFLIPCAGAQQVRVVSKPTAVTNTGGAPTITLVPTLQDGVTADPIITPTSFAAPVANTAATATVSGLTGQRAILMTITVAATSALTYGAGGLLEFTAL